MVYGPKVEGIAANVRECLKAGKSAAAAFAASQPAVTEPETKKTAAPAAKKTGTLELKAPVSGKVLPMSASKDENFASCMMGDGVVIQPTEDVIVAPCDGTVTLCSEANVHALGLQSDSGIELLIHVGIDTVSMKGEGFKILKEEGSKMKTGEPLLRFSRSLIESKGLCADVMLIVLECDEAADAKYITGIDAKAGKTTVANI